MKELQNYLKNGVEAELHRQIVRNLEHLGMECIIVAKLSKEYINRTGNLENSIGYLILKDGQIISSTFGNGEGGKQGKIHAGNVSKQYQEGYALIVVAGMEYAGYVEDVHNLAVLKPAENYARSKAEQIMRGIIDKLYV